LREGFEVAHRCGTGAAEAVIDTRDEEKACELGGIFGAAHFLLDPFVVVNAAQRGDQLVREAVDDHDFAAVIAEAGEVRIVCADHVVEFFDGLFPHLFEARGGEGLPIEVWVLGEVKAHVVEGYAEGFAGEWSAAGACEGGEVSAAIHSIPHEVAVGAARAFPNFAKDFGIRFGENAVADFCADELFGVVIAMIRVVDDAVFDSVVVVARRDGGGGGGVEFGFGNEVVGGEHGDFRPDVGGDEAMPIDGGAAGEDAVVIFRKALGFHEGLASAGGGAGEIRITRGLAIKFLRQRFADDRHFVNAEVSIVDDQLPIVSALVVERETAAAAFMAGVSGGSGEALRGRSRQTLRRAADEAAAAGAAETAVPIREREGDPDFDVIAGGRVRDGGGDAAEAVGRDSGIDGRVGEGNFQEVFAAAGGRGVWVEGLWSGVGGLKRSDAEDRDEWKENARVHA
jgi:hypothetical protein